MDGGVVVVGVVDLSLSDDGGVGGCYVWWTPRDLPKHFVGPFLRGWFVDPSQKTKATMSANRTKALLPLAVILLLSVASADGFLFNFKRKGFNSALSPVKSLQVGRNNTAPSPSANAGTDECVLRHDTCAQVKENCPLGSGGTFLINYYWLHYCLFEGVPVLSFILLTLWLLTIFSLLGSTADEFFVVQLETLSDILKLSPSTAGITLLALGNSAPDTFSDIASVEAGTFALALNELIGASMFLTTIVFGAVILVSTRWKGVKAGGTDSSSANSTYNVPMERNICDVEKGSFIRDVTVFFLALLLILFFTATGKEFTIVEAIGIMSIYIVYVIGVVVYTSKTKCGCVKAAPADRPSALGGSYLSLDEGGQETHKAWEEVHHHERYEGNVNIDCGTENADECCHDLYGLDWPGEEGSTMDKVLYVAEFPFSVLRWCSIANGNTVWDRRRRILASVAPVGAVCIFVLDFSTNWTGADTPYGGFAFPISDTSQIPAVIVPLLIALSCGVFIYCKTDDENTPSFYMFFVFLAFIATIAWLDLIGNEVVALLQSLGTITGLTNTQQGTDILGITVLSWANSIGDFVADTAVAKAGSPRMGISSVFGSPLLTACLGLGLAVFISSLSSPTQSVQTDIASSFSTIMVSFGFLAFNLMMSFAVVTYNGFNVPRNYAFVLFGFYGVFMVISTLETIDVIQF